MTGTNKIQISGKNGLVLTFNKHTGMSGLINTLG